MQILEMGRRLLSGQGKWGRGKAAEPVCWCLLGLVQPHKTSNVIPFKIYGDTQGLEILKSFMSERAQTEWGEVACTRTGRSHAADAPPPTNPITQGGTIALLPSSALEVCIDQCWGR